MRTISPRWIGLPRHALAFLAWHLCLLAPAHAASAYAASAYAASPQPSRLEQAGQALFDAVGATGVLLVVVTPQQVAIHGYGETQPGNGQKPGAHALLRVNSTSKLLAADVALTLQAQGVLKLEHPLQRYLPKDVLAPRFGNARLMTLQDLALHISSLPRNISSAELARMKPASGSAARMRWLPGHTLAAAPGTQALYSNLGYDLLADALAFAAGTPYPALLQEKLTKPLGMSDTTATPSAEQCARLIQGEPGSGPCKDTSASAGSGGLYSSPADMATWLRYMLGLHPARQPDPRALELIVKRSALGAFDGLDKGGEASGLGLGWVHLAATPDRPAILQRTGGGPGFSSFIAIAPARQTGVFAIMSRSDQAASAEMVRQVNVLIASAP